MFYFIHKLVNQVYAQPPDSALFVIGIQVYRLYSAHVEWFLLMVKKANKKRPGIIFNFNCYIAGGIRIVLHHIGKYFFNRQVNTEPVLIPDTILTEDGAYKPENIFELTKIPPE